MSTLSTIQELISAQSDLQMDTRLVSMQPVERQIRTKVQKLGLCFLGKFCQRGHDVDEDQGELGPSFFLLCSCATPEVGLDNL